MKNTSIKFISQSIITGFCLIIMSVSAFAAPLVRSSSSSASINLYPTYQQFINDIGGTDNGAGGSYPNGYRRVDWDTVADNQLLPNNLIPPDFFNTVSPRGAVLSSACSDDRFKLSAANSNSAGYKFGNINPEYLNEFSTFTGQRLFSGDVGGCNFVDVNFYVPGTKIPATVKSFAVVLMDVDSAFTTGMKFYGVDGKPLNNIQYAPFFNRGVSFLGVTYTGEERIAKVRIFSGNGMLGDPDVNNSGAFDIVVMDDFIYSEPRAIGQHQNDFDGDGTADLSVFRPSNGVWYVLNSGSNTYSAAQFGAAGDMAVDGDFDGDSRNDYAVFRPSNGVWYVLQSSNGETRVVQFGLSGDKPVAADFDKDGKTDIAVWRGGIYHILQSSNNQYKATQWGLAGDLPIGAAVQ